MVLSGDVPLVGAEFVGRSAGASRRRRRRRHAHHGVRCATPRTTGASCATTAGGVARSSSTATRPRTSATSTRSTSASTCSAPAPCAPRCPRSRSDNAQGELYLTDVVHLLLAAAQTVAAFETDDEATCMGVNSRVELAEVNARHAAAPARAAHAGRRHRRGPGHDVRRLGRRGRARHGHRAGTHLLGTHDHRRPQPGRPRLPCCATSSSATAPAWSPRTSPSASSAPAAASGPFAHMRPGTVLAEGAKAGSFVEIKASRIGEGSKVPHLSYVGDADHRREHQHRRRQHHRQLRRLEKHATTIGDNVKIGSDTMLVAPVTVGDGAYTAAGSVITRDVPPGALGVARGAQENSTGYAERRAARRLREAGGPRRTPQAPGRAGRAPSSGRISFGRRRPRKGTRWPTPVA